VKTPNLDALAEASINFTHAISECPVCSPYRASLLTGQRPLTHGVFVNDVYLQPNGASVADNTIFVFTSDHGDMLGSQGQTKKQRLWDESIRIPSLLIYPDLPGWQPRETDAPLSPPKTSCPRFWGSAISLPLTVLRDWTSRIMSRVVMPTLMEPHCS